MRGKRSDSQQKDSANIMDDAISIDKETFYTDYEISKDDSVILRFLDLAKFIMCVR